MRRAVPRADSPPADLELRSLMWMADNARAEMRLLRHQLADTMRQAAVTAERLSHPPRA